MLAAVPAACGGGDEAASAADVEVVEAGVERQAPPPGAPAEHVVAGIDAFALAAEQRMAADAGGNTVLSPTSIATAFAMVSAGAGDTTSGQITDVFGFPDQDVLHDAMNSLTTTLADAGRGGAEQGDVTLEVTSALWAQQGFRIEQAFLDTLASSYGAGVPTTDFEGDPDGARRAINEAVAEATRDRIPELMTEGSVTRDTRAVVVDAVYLEAPWASPFPEDATAPQDFHLADGTTVEVPMMHATGLATRAAELEGYTAVELPYAGGDLAMLLVVPDAGTPLDDVVASLDESGLGAVAGGLEQATVDVALPRWDTGSAVDLGPVLTAMGLPVPGGDLPGIAPDLTIGAAVHAADITVDEAGTEAAAATGVGIEITAAPVPGEVVSVVADRPFLFAVRHLPTGAPLFLGRVADPRG